MSTTTAAVASDTVSSATVSSPAVPSATVSSPAVPGAIPTLSEADLRAMLLDQNERRRVSGFDRIVMRVSLMTLLWARHHTAPAELPHEEQLRLVVNDRARAARLHEHSLAALRLR